MHLQRPANKPLARYVARTTAGGRDRPVAQVRHNPSTDIATGIRPHVSNYEVYTCGQHSTPPIKAQETRRLVSVRRWGLASDGPGIDDG
ncbi:MAG: hypothetical protein ACTHMP_24810 [Thermomicrobiales bacterium]